MLHGGSDILNTTANPGRWGKQRERFACKNKPRSHECILDAAFICYKASQTGHMSDI